jgi:cytochrome oxidase Cu insertion factor (SCO1/SenC/PrrC family)
MTVPNGLTPNMSNNTVLLFSRVLLAVSLVMMLVTGCNTTAGSPNYGNSIGNLAYDFSLSDVNGNIVTLSELRGHPVVLNFWYAV